jgi:ArsR family transcriptional regulator
MLSRIPKKKLDHVPAVAALFKTLADPTRLKILFTLTRGEACVHELCAALSMSQPAVSHQLRTLRTARLVNTRRQGREIFYSLADEHVVELIDTTLAHVGE